MPKPTHAKRELTDKFIKAQTTTGKLERFPDLLPNLFLPLLQISEFPTGDFGSNRQAVSV